MLKTLNALFLASAVALAPTLAFAQATTAPAQNGQSATAAGEAVAEFTPDMVDPANPFGEIDVSAAGTADADLKLFFDGLTPEQQAELEARCGVILNPVHAERYAEEAPTILCTSLVAATLIEGPAADGTTMPAPATTTPAAPAAPATPATPMAPADPAPATPAAPR